jgi:hypothetical protein
MARTAMVAAMLGAFVLGSAPAPAAPLSEGVQTMSELSAQTRPRPRLRVSPGRLLYRDCTFRLVQQVRPDGVFVVPRQRCWWVRG